MIQRAREHGVQFLGHRDDVDALYAAMDVFVLASHREGYPRAAMEAAAMGLPIVATDVRGCREVVRPELNGVLVPPGAASGIAAALASLVAEPARRQAMGAASRARALEHFDERRVVATVLETYRSVAARKGLPWR